MAALYLSGHISLTMMMIRTSSVKIKGMVKIFFLVSLPCLIDEILYLSHSFTNSHFFWTLI